MHWLRSWLAERKPAYMGRRAYALAVRYGLTDERGKRRVMEGATYLAELGCPPTFMVPGRLVERNAPFFRDLEAIGVELGVHGYDHVDFRGLSDEEIVSQLSRAASAFSRGALSCRGFRCPYLGCTPRVAALVPDGLLTYSSNVAIRWPRPATLDPNDIMFEQLSRFYAAEPADTTLAVPRQVGRLVEIPCSIPDDLQLFDGLNADAPMASRAWRAVLEETHRRGEMFVMLVHTELLDRCLAPFAAMLSGARRLRPAVWVTRLRDVADWWCEKSRFTARARDEGDRVRVELECSDRATVLVRGLEGGSPWHDRYRMVEGRSFTVPSGVRPFVGVGPDVSAETVNLLREQGYVVEASDGTERYGVRLDARAVAAAGSDVALIEQVERSDGPLLRFWRWPNGARSALCLSGDLDALSLLDYAKRVYQL